MTDLHAATRALAHEEFAQGRDLLVAIVAEQPTWADAWALLSGAHLAMAEVDAATAASERALALAPDGFLPHMKAGELALRLGHIAVAETEFLAAVRATEPDTADAAAARRALAVARRATRAGIVHRATLPQLGSRFSWAARPFHSGWTLVRRIRRPRPAREAI
jgi:hypothetical protein